MAEITREGIARDYAHRVAMDAKPCPVCCGDRATTDPKYAGRELERNTPSPVYVCLACAVWCEPEPAAPPCPSCGGAVIPCPELEEEGWMDVGTCEECGWLVDALDLLARSEG